MRRQPSRLQLIRTNTTTRAVAGVAATTAGVSGSGGLTYRDAGTTATHRTHIDFLKGMRSSDPESRAQILDRQTINGPIQLQHYIQPKLDAMAPLLLPDLHDMDGGFQDRIDSYFSSSRLPLNQRSRSFFDSSSVSGRSFRSLHTSGNRPTGSRHQLQSMRSDRGLQHVLPEVEDDAVDNGGGEGVPIDLRSSASAALRSESQRV